MDQDLDGLTLLDLTINCHFNDFEKDNGFFTTRQLLEFVAFSNKLVWGYYYEGNDKFTVGNLNVIHRLHQDFWTSIKELSKTKIPNYLACTYFKKKYTCPPDKSEYTQFQFLKKERIEELVIYLSFSISYIINYEELEEKNLIKHEEFLTELKSITKDLKEDYENDNDIFDYVYAELLEVEDKPNFNKLLILLLNKNYKDMYEYDFDEDTKQKIIDIFNVI